MKDIFKKIASLVVEVDSGPATTPGSSHSAGAPPERKTIADLVRDAPGPNLDEVHVPVPTQHPSHEPEPSAPAPAPAADSAAAPAAAAAAGPVIGSDGKVDVNAIYAKANLPATPFTAEQAYEMVQDLPSELPLESKRKMVKITLGALPKSLGVTPESVVSDAARKAAALHSFVEGMTKQSEMFIAKMESDIRGLEEKIAEGRRNIEMARHRLEGLESGCELEAIKLQETAEFFSTQTPSAG